MRLWGLVDSLPNPGRIARGKASWRRDIIKQPEEHSGEIDAH